ncbi:hypothetical protein D3C71_197500 [compost metagenome]
MKLQELERTLGLALIPVSDAYHEVMLPMTFEVYVDLESIERDQTGKVVKANTLLTGRWDMKHLRTIDWEVLVGEAHVVDGVNRFLGNLGIVGRVSWAPMAAQEPEQFEFKMKPFMVDEFFPDLAHRDDIQREERRKTPRPEYVGRPQLRVVGRASA